MKKLNRLTERAFEKLVSIAIAVLGNSFTFIVALVVIIYWLTNKKFYTEDIHNSIGDVILGVAFLSLFIIQKSFNRFSALLQLKVNELVASHDPASNRVINLETKTEHEIIGLSKEIADLVEQVKEAEEEIPKRRAAS